MKDDFPTTVSYNRLELVGQNLMAMNLFLKLISLLMLMMILVIILKITHYKTYI